MAGRHASKPTRRRAVRAFAGAASLAALFGCNMLVPLAVVSEHKKKVNAEFDKLPGNRVAILVWVDQATLFDYPHARFELSAYVEDKLAAEFAQRKLEIDLVDARDVEDYVQRDMDARIDPQTVGRRFKADYVVFSEILRFQIRDADQPQLVQGRLDANVSIHEVRPKGDPPVKFALAPVECAYPDAPVILNASNSSLVREGVYRLFSERVARKFYDYTESQ